MAAELFGVDLFAKHTDVNGRFVLRSHRVWDKARFVAARQNEATAENAKQKPGEPRLASFVQIDEATYLEARKIVR